jgi:hypothetical protein
MKSFFEITEIELYINGEEIMPQITDLDEFEKDNLHMCS